MAVTNTADLSNTPLHYPEEAKAEDEVEGTWRKQKRKREEKEAYPLISPYSSTVALG